MTYRRTIPILNNKKEAGAIDGMSTLMIYGYFLVWLLVLVFPLGGLQDGSELVWLILLVSSTPI